MLILMRHGITRLNELGRVQGSTDVPLTERGRRQANRLGGWLMDLGLPVRTIYTSKATRALETAEILAAILTCSVNPLDGLQERDLGPFEGMDRSEVIQARFLTSDASQDLLEQWDGVAHVENGHSIARRAISALASIGALDPVTSSDFLVVTHSGVIEVLLTELLGLQAITHKWIKLPPASSVALSGSVTGRRLLHLWPNPEGQAT